MALGMKDISNLGYMHCTTAVSLEMSDEPKVCLEVDGYKIKRWRSSRQLVNLEFHQRFI